MPTQPTPLQQAWLQLTFSDRQAIRRSGIPLEHHMGIADLHDIIESSQASSIRTRVTSVSQYEYNVQYYRDKPISQPKLICDDDGTDELRD